MTIDDKHMVGFEKEALLRQIYSNPLIHDRFPQWCDFIEMAKIMNPDLSKGAFEPRPCRRKLRYIGYDSWSESERLMLMQEDGDDFFVYGESSDSITFNGATYTVEGRERRIGSAYFEIVEDSMGIS